MQFSYKILEIEAVITHPLTVHLLSCPDVLYAFLVAGSHLRAWPQQPKRMG